ncbi:MAG: 23S rRNA (guanosine-2'-O-)-methyltransferase RlmB [Elusimicrobia bacterium]|nr:23S rRNA (guanosine-2'-O-)-methyltransferase RlmB [Elusimicrobiota bacterium]
MAYKIIDKRSAPQVHLIRQVRDAKDRNMVFCEGEKLISDLFRSQWRPRSLFCTPKKYEQAKNLIPKGLPLPISVLSESVMEFCSDLSNPQGLIVLAKPPENWTMPSNATKSPLILVIHGVQLPQNVGALLRTAEAAGVTHVYVTSHSADVWGPKSLRGSSGSAFRLPVFRMSNLSETIERLHSEQVRCVAASQVGRINYDQLDWEKPVALIVGSEGGGFALNEMKLFDETIQIPMQGQVESLNVANAAAVCLFEGARQRRHAIRK